MVGQLETDYNFRRYLDTTSLPKIFENIRLLQEQLNTRVKVIKTGYMYFSPTNNNGTDHSIHDVTKELGRSRPILMRASLNKPVLLNKIPPIRPCRWEWLNESIKPGLQFRDGVPYWYGW